MFDNFDMMDEILEEVKSKERNFDAIFKIGPGETKKIRFLGEGNTGLMFTRHGRYDKNKDNAKNRWTVPCPVSFDNYRSNKGKQRYHKTNCPYDQFPDDAITKTEHGFGSWLIYNLTDNCKQVFCFKVKSKKGPIPDLAAQYKEKGTIMDRSFKIEKENSDNFPETKITKDDPDTKPFVPTSEMIKNGFVVNMPTFDIQTEILKMMAQAWCPSLLGNGTEFYLPAYHQPNHQKKIENDIDALLGSVDDDMLPSVTLPGEYDEDAEIEDLSRL